MALEATIEWDDRTIREALLSRKKNAAMALRRGVDVGSRVLAREMINNYIVGKYPPHFARRSNLIIKALKRSARFLARLRDNRIYDHLILNKAYARAIEYGGRYPQWIPAHERRVPQWTERQRKFLMARYRELGWLERGPEAAKAEYEPLDRIRVRTYMRRSHEEPATHMLQQVFTRWEKAASEPVSMALGILMADGRVPTVSELTASFQDLD